MRKNERVGPGMAIISAEGAASSEARAGEGAALSSERVAGCAGGVEHKSRKATTGKATRDFMTGALSETGDIQQHEVDPAAPHCQEQNGRSHAWAVERTQPRKL